MIVCKYFIYDNEEDMLLNVCFANADYAKLYVQYVIGDRKFERYDVFEKIT